MVLELDLNIRRGAFHLNLDATLTAPITGIFGPSGSGKSTLLGVIAGLITPHHGRIILDQKTLLDTTQRVMVPPEQRHIGLVYQDAQLFPHLSVRDNLLYGFKRRAPLEQRFTLDDMTALLEINHLLSRRPQDLSGGEKQRVALGRAILYSPRLLLLDEPLSSLDETRKTQILPFLRRIRDEVSIPMLYVSHSMREIDYLTEHVVYLGHSM
jgi:molybdate transport system ATP-binding protein